MRKTVFTILVVLAVALICFLAAGYAAIKLTKKPQSTPLILTTPTIGKTLAPTKSQPKPTATSTSIPIEVPTQTSEVELSPTAQLATFCGQSGQQIILVLGRSIHLPTNSYRADLVRLVKVNFDTQQVDIYALPAELVVETPNLVANYQTQTSRLGDIYTTIINHDGVSSESDYRGTQAIAQAILDNFGVAASHYFSIKEDVVIKITDTLGGIEVTLPQQFTMPSYSKYKGMVLQPGKYVFDGDMVHAYMTYLINTPEEWQRISRQNVLLDGIRQKMLDPAVYLKIVDLFKLYQQNIVTDLSLEEIAAFSCLVKDIPSQNIVFNSLPQEKVSVSSDGSMHMLDASLVVNQLHTLFGVP